MMDLAGRLAVVLLGVFLAALAIGVGLPPASPDGTFALVARLGVAALLGAIGVGCLALALGGDDNRSRHRSPEPLATLCLVCGATASGTARLAAGGTCTACAAVFAEAPERAPVESYGRMAAGFAAAIGFGILFLGLSMLFGPYLDGERRIWVLIAAAALGLLLAAVGGEMAFASRRERSSVHRSRQRATQKLAKHVALLLPQNLA